MKITHKNGYRWARFIATFPIIALGCASQALAEGYEYGHASGAYTFHVIAESVPNALAQDINNDRTVVGFPAIFPEPHQAFIWKNGELTLFSAPDADLTFANGINDRRLVAGHSLNILNADIFGPHVNTGFLKLHNWFIDINYDPFSSWALDVNNFGAVVGVFCPDDGATPGCQNDGTEFLSAYLLDRSGFQDISPPGSVFAVGISINDRKETAGFFFDENFEGFGFLRSRKGRYTTIAVPGALYTEANGINNRGMIVGSYDDADGMTHGYIRTRKGKFKTIDFPDGGRTILTGINHRGDICGFVADDFFQPLFSFVAFRD